jgi:hypothetical protein
MPRTNSNVEGPYPELVDRYLLAIIGDDHELSAHRYREVM